MGKWTRRGFITAGVVGGGALVVGVAVRPGYDTPAAAKLVAEDGETMISTWVKIDTDNHVTAIVPHSEMGQGAQTALTQMLADEMDVSWDQVSFMEAPAEDLYANWAVAKGFILGNTPVPSILVGTVDGVFMQASRAMHVQVTGGSASVRATGVHGMRVAGAAARVMLIEAAARDWQVDVGEITTGEGKLRHDPTGREAAYADYAAAAGANKPPLHPTLKTPDQFRIMGRSKPRRDIPSKVDGSAVYGIDARVEGMKIATIKAAPVFGARVAGVDAARAESMPGVVAVVTLDDAVAVVADGYWQAKKALDTVTISWTETGVEKTGSEDLFGQFQSAMERGREQGNTRQDLTLGDASSAIAGADMVIERQYKVPYLAHACMEPMNAVARVRDGRCEVWTGTQNPLGTRYDIAAGMGMDVENVTLHQHTMGGGFGRRSKADAAIQAARLSRETGVPVKLIWSREEDIRHDHYRPAIASSFRGVLDANGKPLAWDNLYVDKHEPVEAPHIPYAIPNQAIHYVDSPTHVPFGAWRSVDHSQHGFFVESFIDELAHEARQDPYRYRRELLSERPRHRRVLDTAAEKAGWDQPLGENRGRGIALQESFGTIVAEVVEVTVVQGKLSVDRVVVAVDPGFAVSPDGLSAQMESGVVFGLTAALYGDITIENGRVAQGNFHDYPLLRIDASPTIETHIITSHEAWGGAGEPGTPGIAPALTNAIFAATGTRVRELPVSRYDLAYSPSGQHEA